MITSPGKSSHYTNIMYIHPLDITGQLIFRDTVKYVLVMGDRSPYDAECSMCRPISAGSPRNLRIRQLVLGTIWLGWVGPIENLEIPVSPRVLSGWGGWVPSKISKYQLVQGYYLGGGYL